MNHVAATSLLTRPPTGKGTLLLAAMIVSGWTSTAQAGRSDGQLHLEVVDAESRRPLAVRFELRNQRGRPERLPRTTAFRQGTSYYFDGQITLPLRRGQYTFDLDAGPEYRTRTGHFEIDRNAEDSKTIEMNRFANLTEEGWWAGNLLNAAPPPRGLPLLLQATQLEWAPVSDPPARLDEPGQLLTFGPAAAAIATTPLAAELPVWLAGDRVDAIGLISRHQVPPDSVCWKLAESQRFMGRHKAHRYADWIYFQVLESGLHVPPASASLSGERSSGKRPTGDYFGLNRTYVHCGKAFSPAAWWSGLRDGQVVVSDGPLLRPLVRGQPPGHVFPLEGDSRIELEIGLQLATRSTIEYLEIIRNGEVEHSVRLDAWAQQNGRLPRLEFAESGWFLIRAVTSQAGEYRRAITGPYFVEKAGRPRTSRRATDFFLNWVAALPTHNRAAHDWTGVREFWQSRRQHASTD